MRAIKRVGMDEKVLVRMKKMLADHDKATKEEAAEKGREEHAKAREMAANGEVDAVDLEAVVKGNAIFIGENCWHRYSGGLTLDRNNRGG